MAYPFRRKISRLGARLVPQAIKDFFNPPPTNIGVNGYYVPRYSPSPMQRVERAISAFNFSDAAGMLFNRVWKFVGSKVASPDALKYEQGQAGWQARLQLFEEINRIIADEPYLEAGLWMLIHGAVGDGFSLQFPWNPDEENADQEKYREAIEYFYALMEPFLTEWAEAFGVYGDGYVQIVAENRRVTEFVGMPSAGIERLADECDKFPDPSRAFVQRDTLSGKVIQGEAGPAYIPDSNMVHGRHRRRSGELYGRSIIFSSRQTFIDALKSFGTLAKRRAASHPKLLFRLGDKNGGPLSPRAVLRFIFGDPDNPASGLVQERAKRGDLQAQEDLESPNGYIVLNGAQEASLLEGNAKFNENGDVDLLIDRGLAPIGVAQQLINGRVANYATAQALKSQLYAMQRMFCKMFEHQIIRPLFRKALLIHGINPDKYKYKIDWGQRSTEEELINQAEIFLDAYEKGAASLKSTIGAVLAVRGQKDIDDEYNRIIEDRRNGLCSPMVMQAMQKAGVKMAEEDGNDLKPLLNLEGKKRHSRRRAKLIGV